MRSVIIVDDEEDCRDTLQETLELSGIDVAGTGANGEEAYQLYEKFLPDVTILDLNMPDYDGNYAIAIAVFTINVN
ncbi:MAG: response regulator [Thaumarchaeota archaeon]|nr:response regulator [Nitrososphaerota archaeon]